MRHAIPSILVITFTLGCAGAIDRNPQPTQLPLEWSRALAQAEIPVTAMAPAPIPPETPYATFLRCRDAIGNHLAWLGELAQVLDDCHRDFEPSSASCMELGALLDPSGLGWQDEVGRCMASGNLGGYGIEEVGASVAVGEAVIPRLNALLARIQSEW
jgi:hypothetical protein